MKQQILPKKMKYKLSKVDMDQLKEKKENQKPTPNTPEKTKNKFKYLEQMKIEMDSTATIKKPS